MLQKEHEEREKMKKLYLIDRENKD